MRRALVVPMLAVSMIVSGCVSKTIIKASSSFHEGYAASAATISAAESNLVAFRRDKEIWQDEAGNGVSSARATLPPGETLDPFAVYLCESGAELITKRRALITLNGVNTVVDPDKLKADSSFFKRLRGLVDPDEPKLPANNTEPRKAQPKCEDVVNMV